MRTQAFVRAAAAVLSTALLSSGAVLAQQSAQTAPEPRTMVDTAPLPATERESLGAVILMEEPVLAQREALLQAQERSAVDTRTMGAGPARLIERVFTRQDQADRQAEDAAKKHRVAPR